MPCSEIARVGRTTRGVRLMKLKEGTVATVAVTERDEEAEVAAPEETVAEDTAEQTEEGSEE